MFTIIHILHILTHLHNNLKKCVSLLLPFYRGKLGHREKLSGSISRSYWQVGMVSAQGSNVFSVENSFLELVDQAAGLVSPSTSHTAIILVSSLCYPPGNPFHLCLVAHPLSWGSYVFFLVYWILCLPLSWSTPSFCGSTSSSLSLKMDT